MNKQDPVETAFAAEELSARLLSLRLRFVLAAAVAAFLPFIEEFPIQLPYFYGFILLFLLTGWLYYRLAKVGNRNPVWSYVLAAIDIAAMVWVVVVPPPYAPPPLPLGAQLWAGTSVYVFVLIATMVFTYAPSVVLWSGIVAAAAWWAGVWWILQDSQSFTFDDVGALAAMTVVERNDLLADFRRVDIPTQMRTSFLFVVVSLALATFVWRVRRLVYRSAAAERARGNLARFFSPNIVAELSTHDEPLRTARQQDVAVLFADIIGFTRLAEDRTPDDVLALLRDIHRIATRQVYAHDGTLDKFLGDGFMATFGTPTTAADDADRALACAKAILIEIDKLNQRRSGAPVELGIGLHFGPVVLGDIGSDERLEYTVIGDTVNVASRLERLTRDVGQPLIVSDALNDRLQDRAAAGDLTKGEAAQLRGRQAPVGFLTWTPGVGAPHTRPTAEAANPQRIARP